MAGSVNKVILVGNLGKDPEVRRMQDGRPVVNMSVATSESWRDKATGERKEKTEWHRVVIFNEGLAKIAEQYLKKGSKVYLEGALQTRKWTDQQGVEKYSTEVVLQGFNSALTMLDRAGGGGGSGEFGGGGDSQDFGAGRPAARQPAMAAAAASAATSTTRFRSRSASGPVFSCYLQEAMKTESRFAGGARPGGKLPIAFVHCTLLLVLTGFRGGKRAQNSHDGGWLRAWAPD